MVHKAGENLFVVAHWVSGMVLCFNVIVKSSPFSWDMDVQQRTNAELEI
jgi:hypothetical protein